MLLDAVFVAEITPMLAVISDQCTRAAQQLSSLARGLTDELEGAAFSALVDELVDAVQRLLRAAHQFTRLQWQWMLEGH